MFQIISAAHCVADAENNYYEIRAGMLRRFSYSPMTEIIRVTNVIVNEGYDQLGNNHDSSNGIDFALNFSFADMKNDLSLLKLERPLSFNRWIRPICLPEPRHLSVDGNPNWRFGPPPGTFCFAIGWGAIKENGPDRK